ncbi:hypothetical protein Ae150APs1_2379 [Pseudonocardia sp. Ae150A_Ps1]|nr:hypothetical protein Ae150APs1_2379 [Pseudonocardia sp. Ae150A_Ps1]
MTGGAGPSPLTGGAGRSSVLLPRTPRRCPWQQHDDCTTTAQSRPVCPIHGARNHRHAEYRAADPLTTQPGRAVSRHQLDRDAQDPSCPPHRCT